MKIKKIKIISELERKRPIIDCLDWNGYNNRKNGDMPLSHAPELWMNLF